MAEQRYQAVLAVLGGVPVTEVSARFGVGRQSVHRSGEHLLAAASTRLDVV